MQNAVFTNIFVYLLYSLEMSIIVIPSAYTHNLLTYVAHIFPAILFIFNCLWIFFWNRISLEFRKIYIFLINSFFLYIPHTVVLKWDALIFFKLFLFTNKVKYFSFDSHSFLSNLLILFDIFWGGFTCGFVLCVVTLNIYFVYTISFCFLKLW